MKQAPIPELLESSREIRLGMSEDGPRGTLFRTPDKDTPDTNGKVAVMER